MPSATWQSLRGRLGIKAGNWVIIRERTAKMMGPGFGLEKWEYLQRQRGTRNWGVSQAKGIEETWTNSWRKCRADSGLLGLRRGMEMELNIYKSWDLEDLTQEQCCSLLPQEAGSSWQPRSKGVTR